jgi:hypothetical protein
MALKHRETLSVACQSLKERKHTEIFIIFHFYFIFIFYVMSSQCSFHSEIAGPAGEIPVYGVNSECVML